MSDAPRFVFVWGSGHMRKWSDVCPVDGPGFGNAKQYMDADAALTQIECLQRDKEITEKAYITQFDRAESLQRELAEKHDEVLALEAAAITPEMRERMRKALQIIEEHNITTSIYAETDAGVIFRDLLGEQG